MGLLGFIILIFIEPSENMVMVEKSYTSLLFIIICLLGMLAVIFPSSCRRIVGNNKDKNFQHNNKGHHPTCGKFKAHILIFRGKYFCAGCAGLFLGAFTAIIIVIMANFSQIMGDTFYLYIGVLSILLSFICLFFLKIENGLLKLLSNYFFVLGSAFLFLIVFSDLYISSYLLVLIIIWILTRISISAENHRMKCAECEGFEDCEYHFI